MKEDDPLIKQCIYTRAYKWTAYDDCTLRKTMFVSTLLNRFVSMETIDFSAFLCSLISLSLAFNVNVFVKIVCILLEQSGSQSHIHTEEQQKPEIDRANSSNALSLFCCLCVQCTHVYVTYTYRNMPIFSSFNWMHVRLRLLQKHCLHR